MPKEFLKYSDKRLKALENKTVDHNSPGALVFIRVLSLTVDKSFPVKHAHSYYKVGTRGLYVEDKYITKFCGDLSKTGLVKSRSKNDGYGVDAEEIKYLDLTSKELENLFISWALNNEIYIYSYSEVVEKIDSIKDKCSEVTYNVEEYYSVNPFPKEEVKRPMAISMPWQAYSMGNRYALTDDGHE